MSKTTCVAFVASVAIVSLASTAGQAQQPPPQSPAMTFFVTSIGQGKGADVKTWHAYLSTQGDGAVNARDRIGKGPWQNFKGEVIAQNVDDLHGDNNKLGM